MAVTLCNSAIDVLRCYMFSDEETDYEKWKYGNTSAKEILAMTSAGDVTSHLIPAIFLVVGFVVSVQCQNCSQGQVLDDVQGGPNLMIPPHSLVCNWMSVKFNDFCYIINYIKQVLR